MPNNWRNKPGLGQNQHNGEIYIAESNIDGYQVTTVEAFKRKYAKNGHIFVLPYAGMLNNVVAAQNAVTEINLGGKGKYNLITNNCECFVNRAMTGKSDSQQVYNTVLGCIVLASLLYILKKNG